ncbi:MAG: ABC transporter substrate-binding protein, partial [Pseudolabrys sp.]
SKDLQTGAGALGIQLRLLNASTERDFEDVFASLKQMQVGGLVIGTDGFFVSESERLAALSGHNAMPAIFQYRAFAAAGGLMSYGSRPHPQRREASRLIVNLKTAKALGVTVPMSLLGRADEVIE